jgi:putative methyltransferase
MLLQSSIAVIQSFSSAIPPFLLMHGVQKSQLKDFTVIDACSAPGNKTVQLGEYIFNPEFTRNVLAFEKDVRRFNILNNTVQRYNSQQNIKTFNENFLQTNPGDKRFKKVKFVLLDPSCSGSGMLSNYMRDLTS